MNDSFGVWVAGSALSVGAGCELAGQGGEIVSYEYDTVASGKSCGVFFVNDCAVTGGGTLKGTGGVCNYAHSAKGSDDSYGILAKDLSVTGVTAEALGGDVAQKTGALKCTGGRSFGLSIGGDAAFTDCAVTAAGAARSAMPPAPTAISPTRATARM